MTEHYHQNDATIVLYCYQQSKQASCLYFPWFVNVIHKEHKSSW